MLTYFFFFSENSRPVIKFLNTPLKSCFIEISLDLPRPCSRRGNSKSFHVCPSGDSKRKIMGWSREKREKHSQIFYYPASKLGHSSLRIKIEKYMFFFYHFDAIVVYIFHYISSNMLKKFRHGYKA